MEKMEVSRDKENKTFECCSSELGFPYRDPSYKKVHLMSTKDNLDSEGVQLYFFSFSFY